MYERISVKLSEDAIMQLDWLRNNVFHCPDFVNNDSVLLMALNLAYENFNGKED